MASFNLSPTGVRIASDFRENLIVDRYDPVFVSMRAGKRQHLCSENSEDAVTWNVFRSLRQIDPSTWLPPLLTLGIPGGRILPVNPVALELWRTVSPPPSLVALGPEGDSEIDVLIETPEWVWFIEAKYQSDISVRTTTRPLRDQVLRNIDVGSFYAGVRKFAFSLLIRDREHSPLGVGAVERYADLAATRAALAQHRPDGLPNLEAVTMLTWNDLGAVLGAARDAARLVEERGYADRAYAWMQEKGLVAA